MNAYPEYCARCKLLQGKDCQVTHEPAWDSAQACVIRGWRDNLPERHAEPHSPSTGDYATWLEIRGC